MSYGFRFEGRLETSVVAEQLWEFGARGMLQSGEEIVAYFDSERALPFQGRWVEEDRTDWLARYYAELKPVEFDRLVIVPSHLDHSPTGGKMPIVLDPAMAFGTGHHATTQLMLAALEALELEGKRVLDVGAGSGILAIAADLLGAEARGLDIDPDTVPAARDNARKNASEAVFSLGTLNDDIASGSYDVLLANLYAELHVELAKEYARALGSGGRLLLSGILTTKLATVEAALAPSFDLDPARLQDEWALLAGIRR